MEYWNIIKSNWTRQNDVLHFYNIYTITHYYITLTFLQI